ncbi:hypothetical protein RB195_026129 [Necator americanus]
MRRAAGVHMCASRHKISALSSQEGRKLPPSLKAEYRREYEKEIKASRSTQDTTPPTPIHPIVRYKKRRSIYKDESPRSGLRPSHTLEGTRSRSDYGIVSQMQRMEEQRKLSDYGLLPPVVLPCVQISSVSLPSRSSTPSRFQRGRHSWKNRFHWGFSSPNMRSAPVPDAESLVTPSSSVLRCTASVPKSKSITFCVPSKDPLQKSIKTSNVLSRMAETSSSDVVNPRRSSVFVKRGSVSMEPIKKVNLEDVYHVYKQLGTGRFGYIKLAEHKQSKQKIAIKFFPRPQIKQVDFVREYNYSFFLSPHPQIIDTYEGMYQAGDDSAFFFVQEFCPRASLREAVEATNQQGIGEANTKKVFGAVLSAIEFMHNENLVHRNLKAENILLFDSNDFSKAKLTDFGLTRKVDATVKYLEYVNNYHAPELCETVVNEVLTVNKSTDIWALGVIFYYCMRGRFPWQKASIMCKPYWEWEQWLKRKNPTLPKRWTPFSEKALKLMKKTLTPRIKDRWTAKDMRKCIAKEKLLKPVKGDDNDVFVYVPSEFVKHEGNAKGDGKKKSTLQHWINTTLSAMAEISEQVVSARDD